MQSNDCEAVRRLNRIILGEIADKDVTVEPNQRPVARDVTPAAPSAAASVIFAIAKQKIAADLQPKLLDYRLKYVVQVRDSNFDVPSLPPDLRMLARTLGSCIVDAPELQADIAPLLEGQRELLQANRLVDPQCVVLEATLLQCHVERDCSRLGVGQIADVATDILASRGENSRLEAKPTGNYLRMLGFSPKRDSQGYALVLTDDLRRKIHRLARDYRVEVVDHAGVDCLRCGELAAAGEGSLETRQSEVQ